MIKGNTAQQNAARARAKAAASRTTTAKARQRGRPRKAPAPLPPAEPMPPVQPQAQWTILDAWHYIIGGDAAETTRQLRSIKDQKERQAFKAGHFDYATFSGTFKQRGKDGLIRHSGLICLDFDHVGKLQALRDRLLKDEYFETMLLFRSPGGDGLKWVIPIELGASTHDRFFDALWWYCRKTYGITPDKQCRDVGRACFLPYDPEAFINPAWR